MNATPTKLYRYFSAEGILRTLESKKLRFAKLSTFNDPFEGHVTYRPPQTLEEGRHFIKELLELRMNGQLSNINFDGPEPTIENLTRWHAFIEEQTLESLQEMTDKLEHSVDGVQEFADKIIRVCCFTSEDKSNEQYFWAHYANHHKGARLMIDKTSIDLPIESVEATEHPPFMPFIKPNMSSTPREVMSYAKILFGNKGLNWSNESEYRAFVPPEVLDHMDRYPLKTECILELHLGIRMSESEKIEATALCKHNFPHVKIRQATKDSGAYRIIYLPKDE